MYYLYISSTFALEHLRSALASACLQTRI